MSEKTYDKETIEALEAYVAAMKRGEELPELELETTSGWVEAKTLPIKGLDSGGFGFRLKPRTVTVTLPECVEYSLDSYRLTITHPGVLDYNIYYSTEAKRDEALEIWKGLAK